LRVSCGRRDALPRGLASGRAHVTTTTGGGSSPGHTNVERPHCRDRGDATDIARHPSPMRSGLGRAADLRRRTNSPLFSRFPGTDKGSMPPVNNRRNPGSAGPDASQNNTAQPHDAIGCVPDHARTRPPCTSGSPSGVLVGQRRICFTRSPRARNRAAFMGRHGTPGRAFHGAKRIGK
jgi:hypothetical protein